MAQNADVKQELVAIADELDRRGLKGMADEVTQILAAVVQEERVASLPDPEYLVQVADKLDQEGRYDEADRVTAYAQQVSMVRSAQIGSLQSTWSRTPGQSDVGYALSTPGRLLNTPAAALGDLWRGTKQLGARMGLTEGSQGVGGQLGAIKERVSQIDRQIEQARQTMQYLQQQKANLMQQGQNARAESAGGYGPANQSNVNQYVSQTPGVTAPPVPPGLAQGAAGKAG